MNISEKNLYFLKTGSHKVNILFPFYQNFRQILILKQPPMKCKSFLSEWTKTFDLFSLSQFLRYKQDNDYKTVSGGLISLLVVAIFCFLFSSNAIATVNKTAIAWKSTVEDAFNPTPATITFNPQGKMMFGIAVLGFNLNDPTQRYFDVRMSQNIVNGTSQSTVEVPLVACTKEHFAVTSQIQNDFDKMGGAERVCPPLNYSFQISGKFISSNMRGLQISVAPCNNSLDPTRPCVNQSVIDASILANGGQLFAHLAFVNPLINPGDTNYLDYYVNDLNFVSFSKQNGAFANSYVEEYQISTDQSLLPFQANRQDHGLTISKISQYVPYSSFQNVYAVFSFWKSSTKTLYERSFNKVDQFFSYVGGLIGTILGFMIFMGGFSLMAFQLDISKKIARLTDGSRVNFSGFNVFSYFLFLVYKLLSWCGCCKDWEGMKQKQEVQEEITKQLDLSLLLQRINFLERAVEYFLETKDLSGRQFCQLQNLSVIKKRRRKFKKYKKELMKKKQEQDSESSSSSEEQTENNFNQHQSLNISRQKIGVSENVQEKEKGKTLFRQPETSSKEQSNQKFHEKHLSEVELHYQKSWMNEDHINFKVVQNTIQVVPKDKKQKATINGVHFQMVFPQVP